VHEAPATIALTDAHDQFAYSALFGGDAEKIVAALVQLKRGFEANLCPTQDSSQRHP
jgi:hypothetical protein